MIPIPFFIIQEFSEEHMIANLVSDYEEFYSFEVTEDGFITAEYSDSEYMDEIEGECRQECDFCGQDIDTYNPVETIEHIKKHILLEVCEDCHFCDGDFCMFFAENCEEIHYWYYSVVKTYCPHTMVSLEGANFIKIQNGYGRRFLLPNGMTIIQ